MILGAFLVDPLPKFYSYVEVTNRKLGVSSALFSGKLSVIRHKGKTFLFFNVRFWLFNPSFLRGVYSWALKKGLRKHGYFGICNRVSSHAVSELLEGIV